MRSRRLKYRFANRGYAALRWPSGLSMMPSQLSPEMAQLSLYECCLMAGLSGPVKARQKTGISHSGIKSLAKKQVKLMRLNAYHNSAHIGQVILACGLLADAAQISQIERDILIVAALIHDYRHLGAKRNKTALWQEALSCDEALPRLIRGGCDSRLITLFYEMVLATSPLADEEAHSIKGNDILSLLLDADLFASLFLPKASVDRLTANLKFEERLSVPHAQLRDGFLAQCAEKGLASLAGGMLHKRLKPSMTYFEAH